MKAMGNNRFDISLVQYWDQNNLVIPTQNNTGNRDPSATLYIYNKRTRALMDEVTVTFTTSSNIQYQNKACATFRSLNTVVGIYKGSILLNPQKYTEPEGYYLVWERCCRNGDINNIVEPGNNGMAFYLEFPPLSIANSAPEFSIPNGQYICNKKDFTMNMSATDADGDELRYSLTTPWRGYTSTRNPMGDGLSRIEYPEVVWSNGISLANIIPGRHTLSIDKNGIIKVNADYLGLYVFAVQCEEFRNGKRIGVVRRDFQLLVIDCSDDAPMPPIITQANQTVTEVSFCPGKSTTLETNMDQDWYYQWQLNGLNIPGATQASIAVADTGFYSVIKSYSKKCTRDTTSAAIHVTIRSLPPATITTSKNILCEGESAILNANATLSQNTLTYTWLLNNAKLADNISSLAASKPGLYQLIVEDKNTGCIAGDTLYLKGEDIQVTLPDSVTMMLGTRITLIPELNPYNPNYTYTWSSNENVSANPNQKDITVSPPVSAYYTFELRSENGCFTTRTVLVKVLDKLYIPSAFSPNNDGINDTFEIFNSKDQIERIRIYNRWGQVIFHSAGYEAPWNGTFQNETVPSGTYPYIIEAHGTTYKGEILVLR